LLFLDHCLAVADAHLDLVQAHRRGQLELVDVQLEPDCWRPFTGLGGGRLVLQPDLHVVTGDPTDPAYVNTWFVEIDRGTENPARLLAKCAHYETYAATGIEQRGGASFPLVVWVMPDETHARKLHEALRSARHESEDLFRVTTPEGFIDLIARGAA
jgi:Replication-relaxation